MKFIGNLETFLVSKKSYISDITPLKKKKDICYLLYLLNLCLPVPSISVLTTGASSSSIVETEISVYGVNFLPFPFMTCIIQIYF